jgi:hypothetical protein
MSTPKKWNAWNKRNYVWITLLLFFMSLAAHWSFGWEAFKNEQRQHGQEPKFNEFVIEASRDTFENWQSEFLQLVWQVAGLSFLFFVGSSQSAEGDERKEAKLDLILEQLYGNEEASKIKRDLQKRYPDK